MKITFISLSTMDPTILRQVPDEYTQIYKRHWKTIKPSVKRGRIRDVYHYPLVSTDDSEIVTKLRETLANYTRKIKINVAFGFILQKRDTSDTSELKFFHPSNNTMLFETPKLIQNDDDRRKLEDDVEQQDAFEYARHQRPSTKWTVDRIICIRFDIYNLNL